MTSVEKAIAVNGSECPQCESLFTPVRNKGHDDDGRIIRVRYCRNCDTKFGTVEVVLPEEFSFTKTDTYTDANRKVRAARRSNDRIFIGAVKVIPGKPSDWCTRALHRMVGKNIVRTTKGHRLCRECRNTAIRKYRFEHRDEINRKQRDYDRRKKVESNDAARISTSNSSIAEHNTA